MKLRMAENSMFAILLRSAWWISAGIGAVVALAGFALLPEAWRIFGVAMAAPFLIIAGIALWRQLQQPSARSVEQTLDRVRAMSWGEFSNVLAAAYRRDGYAVDPVGEAGVDFEVTKTGRRIALAAKRWKVARTGVEPLKDLAQAAQRREVDGCIFVAAGEVTAQARTFAANNRITLVEGPELARLMPEVGRGARAA